MKVVSLLAVAAALACSVEAAVPAQALAKTDAKHVDAKMLRFARAKQGGDDAESDGDSGPADLTAASDGSGQFVPFGKHVPRRDGVTYYTSSGAQECGVCKLAIGNAGQNGVNFHNLCGGLAPEYMDMCAAQQKVLQACPEFVNDWCYQDLGGTQKLRSPCPSFLKCHYCLGINPLYCL